MLSKLPEDIIQIVFSFSSPRVLLAVGREPSALSMLLAGGPSRVLESILRIDGDLKSMMYLKHIVPPSTAIVKAVQTHKKDMVKRVCILWETWCSDHGFAAACHQQFAWAIKHISPVHPVSTAQYNRIYFELRQYDKIDLSIDHPFTEFVRIPQTLIAQRIHEYTPYRDTLSTHEQLLYHLLNNAESEVADLLENEDSDVDLSDALYSAIKYGKQYSISRWAYNIYGQRYGVTWKDMRATLVEAKDINAMAYFKIPHLDVHRAVLEEDVNRINQCLVRNRTETLDVLSMYDQGYQYYKEALSNPCLTMDQNGFWQGAPNAVRQFMFGHPVYSSQWRIRNLMTKARTLDDLAKGGPLTILQLLEKYGYQLLDNVRKPFYITPQGMDKEAMWEVVQVLVDRGFEIKKVVQPVKPSLFFCDQTIYHNFSADFYESIDMKSSLIFEESMLMNDVLLALECFGDRMPYREPKKLDFTFENQNKIQKAIKTS